MVPSEATLRSKFQVVGTMMLNARFLFGHEVGVRDRLVAFSTIAYVRHRLRPARRF